jgi:hypothetical protein
VLRGVEHPRPPEDGLFTVRSTWTFANMGYGIGWILIDSVDSESSRNENID